MKDKVFAIAIDDEGVFITELTKDGIEFYNMPHDAEEVVNITTLDTLWKEWTQLDSIEDIPQEIRMRTPVDIVVTSQHDLREDKNYE